MKRLFLAAFVLAGALSAQPLNPAKLLQPPTDAWPTYNGDYSGRRYSPLKQINPSNVNTLNLAWTRRFTAGGGRGGGAVQIKATPLAVNGILYFAAPDNAWAVDARTGRELWHFEWQTKGGIHIGNRGFGMYGDWLYFETPDCYLISLDAKTGKMRWNHQIAEVKREYFCTPAPLVIKNHIIVGVAVIHWTYPDIWNRAIRKPGRCNGVGTRRRVRASRAPKRGPRVKRWSTEAA